MKSLALLGSTGSIGRSACDIVRRHPDRFRLVALAAGCNVEVLAGQVREFRPSLVCVRDEKTLSELKNQLDADASGIAFVHGQAGAAQAAAHPDAEMTVSAMVGAAGLEPTLAAIRAGKAIALANKETMVIAGGLMNRTATESGSVILPIDSEHSALFQCLTTRDLSQVRRLILTASGGPFRTWSAERIAAATVEDALNHPNWKMGPKITIDSATMMNKGLEVIEARWLFSIEPERVDILVHPSSTVHSLVEYVDGAMIAQLGVPDMRQAISYALGHPDRVPLDLPPLDLTKAPLVFEKPDMEKFPLIAAAYDALGAGGTHPAVLNAANEIAVAAFLGRRIGFTQIASLVQDALAAWPGHALDSLDDVLEADRWARSWTEQALSGVRRAASA